VAVAAAIVAGGLLDLSAVALANVDDDPKAEYDGRFSFLRVRVGQPLGMYRRLPPWAHDFPRADFHFMKILEEITFV
jgi:hypothetical protein